MTTVFALTMSSHQLRLAGAGAALLIILICAVFEMKQPLRRPLAIALGIAGIVCLIVLGYMTARLQGPGL